MHRCADDGTLRAELDGDVQDPAPCPACARRRAGLRADRDVVAAALATLDAPPTTTAAASASASASASAPAPDAEAALARLRDQRPDLAPARPRMLRLVASVAALLIVAAVIGTPTGRSATASVLSTFRAERVQAVAIDPDAMGDLEALEAIADVDDPEAEPVVVEDVAAAAEVAGFTAAVPADTPEGAPVVAAVAPTSVEAALSSERAPTLPADLDGAVLHVGVPGVVVQQWAGDDDVPQLVVVEAGVPEVTLEGGDLADLRSWVLDDPGLPDDVAAQLEALGDWRTTLPIPVPAGAERPATVDGVEAVGVDYGVLRGVVWLDGDRIRGVAGPGTIDELAALGAELVR